MPLFYFIYTWFVFAPVGLVATAILSSLLVLVCLFSPKLGSRYIARTWAWFLYRLSLSSMRVEGQENLKPGQSYVVVANHISQFDILVVYGWLNLDLKWVMKKELRKMPFIGFSAAAMGHIFIDRKNSQKAFDALTSLRETLPAGTSVMFFPEGTRSQDGQIKRFKRGAFSAATALQMPILPISITGTDDVLPSGTIKLSRSESCIRIHPPIGVDKVAEMGELEMAKYCQEIVASGLKKQPVEG